MDKEQWERYDKMCISRAIDTADDMSWCPTPGCSYAFIKDQNELNCNLCHKRYCLDCRVDFHVGKTCLEFKVDRVNQQDDTDIVNMIKNVLQAKMCTQCKFWVEKN